MVRKLLATLNWIGDKLEDLSEEIGAQYARELLAAHGLLDIDMDHIRRKLRKGLTE